MKRLDKVKTIIVFNPMVSYSHADELKFNPAFLNDNGSGEVDLSWVKNNNQLPEGDYNIVVNVNDNYAFTDNVKFIKKSNLIEPSFTISQIKKMGISIDKTKEKSNKIFTLDEINNEVRYEINKKDLSIDVTIPQRFLNDLPRDYINPETWDEGASLAWLNYDLNGSNSHYKGIDDEKNQDFFANVKSGINYGPWRLRDNSTWSENDKKLRHLQTWIGRDLKSIKSQLLIGDSYTSSEIFDSYALRGMIVSSNDNMLPSSQIGYAPEVRGIASTNATIIIKQNGYVIYQKSVPPGQFLINDIYPTSSGGDLDVTIKENDGSTKEYTIPYASVPNMVRNGQFKHMFAIGKYISVGNQESPKVLQSQIYYGLTRGITTYGGVQLSQKYKSYSLGLAQNVGILGAYSIDVTNAESTLPDNRVYRGDSLRLRYSKMLNNYGTRFNFYSWRYSTKGFYNFSDTTYKRLSNNNAKRIIDDNGDVKYNYEDSYDLRKHKKSKNQVMLSQGLDNLGSISLSWINQNFWNAEGKDETLQFSWNNTFKNINVGLSVQHIKNTYNSNDNTVSLSLSIPFGNLKNSSRATYSLVNSERRTENQIGVSGYFPDNDNMYYSITQRHSSGNGYGAGANLRYQGDVGEYNIGYDYNKNNRNISYGASGGVVLHEGGVTLSQPLGDTNILVKAPGASDVVIKNQKGIKTDRNGYAVVPYATPYRINRVELDVTSAAKDVEINEAVVSSIPTEGAFTFVKVSTQIGNKVMFILRKNNKVVPFGASVVFRNDDDNITSIVGDDGAVYMSGMPEKGKIHVTWGSSNEKNCTAEFNLSEAKSFNAHANLYTTTLQCK